MGRRTRVLAGAVIVSAVTITGGVLVTSSGGQRALAARPPSRSTATIQRRTLSAMVSQAGILTYRARADGSPYSIINLARGTYTRLPAVGRVVSAGHVLYRVNDRPVVLLHGATPAYRPLSAGATGPDVAELNAGLAALGYATPAALHPRSAFFGSATATAVKKLQAALRMTLNGRLGLGQVVFAPTAVRVTTLSAQPGSHAQPGQTVIQATSTTRQVQVALSASQQTSMAVGDKVSITLPDNRTTPGIVSHMATVATCPSSAGAGGSGSSAGSAAPGTDTCSSGASGTTPTIPIDVSFSRPAAAGRWDQAPVQVGITTATVRHALVVPVTALLARSGGGYAVEVVGTGAPNHLVAVALGLFDDADGLVQVGGAGLTAGRKVVVPST